MTDFVIVRAAVLVVAPRSLAQSILLLAMFGCLTAAAPYQLQDDFSGDNFFGNFTFFTARDPTNGFVQFVDQKEAMSTGLAGVTAGGHVFMSADSTRKAEAPGRKSVRVTSKQSYNGGLFVHQLTHMPVGCGTWPAFWMVGPSWPSHGEVDIMENINNATTGRATLHTSQGCNMAGTDPSTMKGVPAVGKDGKNSTDCYVNAAGEYTNEGCGVLGQDGAQGNPFNAGHGGVYATEWTETHFKMWFWPDGSQPPDVLSSSPNPGGASWGLPLANFPLGNNCDPAHFSDLQIVYDLTFCGWAGDVFGSMCPGKGQCEDFVANNPAAFAEAYWNITTLRVFQKASLSVEGELSAAHSTS